MEARKRISKAIIKMMSQLPFYAELMMRAKILKFTEQMKKAPNYCPSMCVAIDGNIYYDDEFIDSMSDDELNFVILHEAAHKAYLHLTRVGKRDHLVWNIAADIAVNYEVAYRMNRYFPNASAPNGVIMPGRDGTMELDFGKKKVIINDVNKKTVEQLYVEIANNLPKSARMNAGGGGGKGNKDMSSSSGLGTPIDMHKYSDEDGKSWSEMTDFEKEEYAERAKDDVIEAATKCKKRGELPEGIEQMLDNLLRAKINWRQYIWKHVVNEIPFDQTLSRPNRRFLTQGLYVPGVVKENVDIVAMVDLSGSISEKEMKEFIFLMTTITNQFRNVNITILSHDSKVHEVTEIRMANEKKIRNAKYRGGGGTDHVPCFKWVKENKRNCPLIVAFTDGYTRFPEKYDVKTPTIWVLSQGGKKPSEMPFGVAIKMEDVE